MDSINHNLQALSCRFMRLKARLSLCRPDQKKDVLIDSYAKAEVKHMGKQFAMAASEGPLMTAGERR
jgi:hypothetical protein